MKKNIRSETKKVKQRSHLLDHSTTVIDTLAISQRVLTGPERQRISALTADMERMYHETKIMHRDGYGMTVEVMPMYEIHRKADLRIAFYSHRAHELLAQDLAPLALLMDQLDLSRPLLQRIDTHTCFDAKRSINLSHFRYEKKTGKIKEYFSDGESSPSSIYWSGGKRGRQVVLYDKIARMNEKPQSSWEDTFADLGWDAERCYSIEVRNNHDHVQRYLGDEWRDLLRSQEGRAQLKQAILDKHQDYIAKLSFRTLPLGEPADCYWTTSQPEQEPMLEDRVIIALGKVLDRIHKEYPDGDSAKFGELLSRGVDLSLIPKDWRDLILAGLQNQEPDDSIEDHEEAG